MHDAESCGEAQGGELSSEAADLTFSATPTPVANWGTSFAENLRLAMQTARDPTTGEPPTQAAVVDGINRRAARLPPEERKRRTISAQYFNELYHGKKTSPRLPHIQAIAEELGVLVSSLVDGRPDRPHVAKLLMRGGGMDDGLLETILTFMDFVEQNRLTTDDSARNKNGKNVKKS